EGQEVSLDAFAALADEVLAEAEGGGPLRFLEGDPRRPARFVACHSLTVARVVARVIRHDPELRPRAHDAVLAALVHDVGMLRVPAAILAHPGPLDDDQRRRVEAHCRDGAAVELADGAVGVVVATPGPRRDLDHPARPVVALLADARGEPLPLPRYLDLAHCDGPSVVRTLSPGERRGVLGRRYPEWA